MKKAADAPAKVALPWGPLLAFAAFFAVCMVALFIVQKRSAKAAPPPEPAPWHYDAAADQHWDPLHGHWHAGPPPPVEQRKP